VRTYIEVNPEADDPAEGYDAVDQYITARAPHMGQAFVDDRLEVWYIMSNICDKHS
jgi:hypothetical protein